MSYQYPWPDVVARLKTQPDWAHHLAAWMASEPFIAPLLRQAEWIAPIPVSRAKLVVRGFDQAWELVKSLHRFAPSARAMPDLLTHLSTHTQHQLDRDARWANAQAAFQVCDSWSAALADRQVLLVDDVMTTGSTLRAAAQALRRHGARRVDCVVFARTPPPSPD